MRLYTTREVADLTGVNIFTLAYWANTGVVRPIVDSGGKRGKGRKWAPHQIDKIRMIHAFRCSGLPMRYARIAADVVLQNRGDVAMLHQFENQA